MEWEDKTKMCQLGNKSKDADSKKEFYDYCLEQMPKFDTQAWDMFANLVTLSPLEMKEDISFWEKAYQYISNVDCNDPKFGLRSGMRIAIIQTICEDELKLQKK